MEGVGLWKCTCPADMERKTKMKQVCLNRAVISGALWLAVTLATPLAHAQEVPAETTPAVDFTQPKFSGPVDDPADYVDPARMNNRSCPDSPYRPGWLMVYDRTFSWRYEIASIYENSLTWNAVLDAGVCTCESKYPDWEELRPEIEALWESISTLPENEWSQETRDIYRKMYDGLKQTTRYKLVPFVKLCRKAGI